MPQFTYPGAQSGGYIYNEGDSINVTWTWNAPPVNATAGLILWVDDPPVLSLSNRYCRCQLH